MVEAKQEDDPITQSRKENWAGPLLFIGPCLMLAGLSFVYLGQSNIADGASQSNDYHNAPGCTPTGVRSSGLPPCSMRVMTVTTKNQIDGGDGPDTYKLGLSRSRVPQQEVTLVGPETPDLYAHVTIGGSVQAKVWQGDILTLTIPGWHCGTSNHPDIQVDSGERSTIGGGLCTLLGGLSLFYGWRAYKKEKVLQGAGETN